MPDEPQLLQPRRRLRLGDPQRPPRNSGPTPHLAIGAAHFLQSSQLPPRPRGDLWIGRQVTHDLAALQAETQLEDPRLASAAFLGDVALGP